MFKMNEHLLSHNPVKMWSIRAPASSSKFQSVLVGFMSILGVRRDLYFSASLLRWMVNDSQFCHHHKLLPHVYIGLLDKL